ncbi:MAG: hypothetical protein WCC04_17135 [Terriglobales bacterium]
MGDFDTIITLQHKLQNARDMAQRDLDQIDRQLQAVTLTLELLRKEGPSKPTGVASEGDVLAELRTKNTQLAGLVAIARRNGGVLLTKDAKHLLQRSGLMKPSKNASNILYNVIKRSERFEHIGTGQYRLKSRPSPILRLTADDKTTLSKLFPEPKPIQ